MKLHEYNEMMAYLLRPKFANGGRIGFQDGTTNRPQIANVDFKQIISDSYKKFLIKKEKLVFQIL